MYGWTGQRWQSRAGTLKVLLGLLVLSQCDASQKDNAERNRTDVYQPEYMVVLGKNATGGFVTSLGRILLNIIYNKPFPQGQCQVLSVCDAWATVLLSLLNCGTQCATVIPNHWAVARSCAVENDQISTNWSEN